MNVLLIAAGAAPAGPVAGALRQLDGLREVEVVEVPEPAGRAELDPVLDRLAGRRLVLAGSPAALGDLLTRLLRRDQLSTTPVGVITAGDGWAGAARSRPVGEGVGAARAGRREAGATAPDARAADTGGATSVRPAWVRVRPRSAGQTPAVRAAAEAAPARPASVLAAWLRSREPAGPSGSAWLRSREPAGPSGSAWLRSREPAGPIPGR